MNVCTFHSASFEDLVTLRDTIGNVVDVNKEKADVGDCCILTCLEFGLSMYKDDSKHNLFQKKLADQLKHARFHAMGSRKALVWISAALLCRNVEVPTTKKIKQKNQKNNKHSEQNIKVEIAKNNAKFGS